MFVLCLTLSLLTYYVLFLWSEMLDLFLVCSFASVAFLSSYNQPSVRGLVCQLPCCTVKSISTSWVLWFDYLILKDETVKVAFIRALIKANILLFELFVSDSINKMIAMEQGCIWIENFSCTQLFICRSPTVFEAKAVYARGLTAEKFKALFYSNWEWLLIYTSRVWLVLIPIAV